MITKQTRQSPKQRAKLRPLPHLLRCLAGAKVEQALHRLESSRRHRPRRKAYSLLYLKLVQWSVTHTKLATPAHTIDRRLQRPILLWATRMDTITKLPPPQCSQRFLRDESGHKEHSSGQLLKAHLLLPLGPSAQEPCVGPTSPASLPLMLLPHLSLQRHRMSQARYTILQVCLRKTTCCSCGTRCSRRLR